MKIVLFIFLALFTFSSSMEAGIFRKDRDRDGDRGKIFPLIKNRLIINERPATPATPNPPPIINPAPLSPPVQKEVTKEEVQEVIDALTDSSDSPSSNVPPWLPLGTLAGGASLMLLRYARSAVSFIKES